MKKLLLLLVMAFTFVLIVNAQDKFIYCELLGYSKVFSTKVTVEIDYGQSTKFFSSNKLVDADGNAIKFNSMVDAMNWMGGEGWEFVQAYVITSGSQNVYHWLLKRNTGTLTEQERESILEGFKTKANYKD